MIVSFILIIVTGYLSYIAVKYYRIEDLESVIILRIIKVVY